MPRSPRFLVAVVLFLVTAAFVVVRDSLQDGENALIQRKYADAVTHLQSALDEASDADKPRVLLLLARARWLAGDVDGAVGDYRRLVRDYPDSGHVAKARLQQAEALAVAKRFQEAAALYREEIERLTGAARKEEIAATYLGLAEKALAAKPADHARAVTFYDLALDLGLSDAKARSVRLLAAEARLAGGNHGDAIRRLDPLIDELTREQGKLRAMLALGKARALGGNPSHARLTLRDLVALAPESPEAADAAFEIARTFGVPTPNRNDLDRAVTALRDFASRYASHPKAKIADYLIARCQYHNGRTELALTSLRKFLLASAGAGLDERADAAAMVGNVLASQGKLEEAITAWRTYLQEYPAHEKWEGVQRAIVDAEYARAQRAYDAGKERYDEARERMAAFARAYPLDGRNPQILLLFGEMLLAEEKYDEARDAYARCVSKYPGHEASSRAQYRIGEIYESKTFHYQKALEAYRAVTWGSWAGRAQQRIALLERKHLHLATSRTFRTGEDAVFKLTSRNIEKVRVRVYRLDLETWFRATHTAGSVERLDIEVIEPDKTFEDGVTEYVPYQQTERLVDIGYREPGAYVVKVDDREFEATTLVLITDIGMIAKTSRHEFFVFTQNLKEQRVEGGVRVVLSNGKRVVAEGETGADGVWRYRGDELQKCGNLSAFVVNAAGSGAGTLDLSGLGYAQGLTAKGYLFTDRPTYQPGQPVHIKGIVREVENGIYKLPGADDYVVEVVSAAGRVLMRRDVQFTPFGTFAFDAALPESAQLGTWRTHVRRKAGGTTFSGSFEVARYSLPRLSVAADLERPVVFRGEPIAGKFEVRHFFGEPAIDKAVRVSMQAPDGRVRESVAKTNAEGVVEFSFESGEFPEEAIARVTAVVAEANASASVAIPVVTTEFTPTLSLVRDVYLTGEPFDVEVTVEDRSGKALVQRGELVLLRQERKNGRVAEVEVGREAFATKAQDGKGTVTFRADRGGPHLVRATAEDRFGNTVTAEIAVTISGDDDATKLRILSDRQHYEVGETLRVKIANRGDATLALRTVQGDGILTYEAIRVPKGESEHEFPLQTLHAPNFALALAMIDGTELRTADREFLVARDLRLRVQPKRDVARPGESIELELEARDPENRPVAAEIALALVDESLLTLYSDNVPAIGKYFYGQRRETEFRTTSSCGWNYSGRARRVSADLVAEEQREIEVLAANEPMPDPSMQPQTSSDEFFLGAAKQQLAGRPENTIRALRDLQAGAWADDKAGLDELRRFDADGLNIESVMEGARVRREMSNRWREEQQLQERTQNVRSFFAAKRVKMPDTAPSNEPRVEFSELGGWVSSVVTGVDGKATVTIDLPDNTTEWRVTARGVTADTYVGQAVAKVRTAKPAQVDVSAPLVLTEGDKTEIRTHVFNTSSEPLGVALGTGVRRGDLKPAIEQRHVDVPAGREHVESRTLTAEAAGQLGLIAQITGGGEDAVERMIQVVPFGVERRDGRAGVVTDGTTFDLSLPTGREYVQLGMRIELGADAGRDLVRAALGDGFRPNRCRRVDLTNHSLAERGLAALAVLGYLERRGGASPADLSRLESMVQASLASLLGAQQDQGGFAWIGKRNEDLRTTAVAARFFSGCVGRGLTSAEQGRDKAIEWLIQQLRRLRDDDRTFAALALAECGRARFETLNSLHRRRANMTLPHLARLALAWQAAGRDGMAGEVFDVLRSKLELTDKPNAVQVESVALATRALLAADPKDAVALRALRWVEKQRRGATWGTPATSSAAIAAIVTAGGTDRAAAREAELEVSVNGRIIATVPRTVRIENTAFDVDGELLKASGNRVEIRLRGRGRVQYSAMLTGFAKGFDKKDRADSLVRTRRSYRPAFLRHDGQEVRPGFGVVSGSYKSFHNTLAQLAVGNTGRVETSFYVRDTGFDRGMSPVVVEEPIPSGCVVPRESIRGSYDHLIVEPDRLIFYFRDGVRSSTVQYELQARFPGTYRALPTQVYGAARPDLVAYGPPMDLEVLPRGAETKDEYRMTPDELFTLGKAYFDAGNYAEAGAHLRKLVDGWSLRDRAFKDVARMMLFVSIAEKDSEGVVRYFEELKDRQPDLVIPFDKILAVGQSYIDLGEFEAALLVFRATAEASFLKEAAVATTLQNLGEVKASLRFLQRLLSTYPDLNTMRVSHYAIGQQLAEVAAGIADGQRVDDKVGTRDSLRKSAVDTFRDFLVWFPEDPLAEEVSFAWATTLVEGKDLDGALAVARAALARYPDSTLEDELLYTVGFAEFAGGRGREAFPILERVANEDFPRPDGGAAPSENKFHAIYLQGQIHHAFGEPAKALQRYDQVIERFSDASEAAEYFRQKALVLPEVASFASGETLELEFEHRNLEKVAFKVYRVDLMRLYLLEKSLNNIRDVLLHGIAPHTERELELGDGKDYRDRKTKLELPLEEAGAYLVVARSGDLVASGMVLRSDLEIEAQESLADGRIRVNVKRDGAFVGDAHVKVVGSGDQQLRGGDTDLRGIFVAGGLVGRATVIAKQGDEYAFFRGDGIHQPARFAPPPVQTMTPEAAKPRRAGVDFDGWGNNLDVNAGNRRRQTQWLQKEVLQKQQKGVEVYRTK